ncbi:phage tail tape measure protein [Cellvibrio mixtus]|uniref:hypothetical protein n=1 Tax=Cellvibrio mixtus TaxID=39650 RepID=UPI0005870CC0|nr:hypothetical protein [Cellvibrio mixtus]
MTKKIIETFITELKTEGAKFSAGLGKSLKEAEKWGERVTKITSGIVIGGIGSTAAFTAGLAAITRGAIETADAFDEQSQRVNISAEDLSAYAYQAQYAGVAQEELNAAWVKLNKTSSDAYLGVGKGADAFEKLGISAEGADGKIKSNAQLIGELADKFQDFEDGPLETSIAMDIFGKSVGPKLLPMLNDGKEGMEVFREEAERMGKIVRNDTAAAAGQFNDNLDKLHNSIDGLGLLIAQEALPTLVELTDTFNDPDTQQGLTNIAVGILNIGAAIVDTMVEAANFSRWVGEEIASYSGIHSDDIVRLEQRRDQILTSLNGDIWDRFTKGGNTDFVDSIFGDKGKLEARLQDELKTIDGMLKEAYQAQQREAVASRTAAANAAKTPPPEKEKKSTFNIQSASSKKNSEWELEQQKEMREVMDRENRAREEADKEVQIQREKFSRIHEEALEADKKVIDLESYRYKRQQDELEKELADLKKKGLLTAELEAEFQTAREEQEATHQSRLKEIKKQAAADEVKMRQVQLAGAETLFSSLGDLAEEFGSKSSRLRKALLIAEKAASIARATIAIKTGIAEAAANPWPTNLAAMATVAAATAGVLTDIKSVNVAGIAHGGLDNVPKEATYLLDKGERVLSPLQNRDLTSFLKSGGGGGGSIKIEVINSATNQAMEAEASMINEDTLRIVLKAVDRQLRDDLGNGRGVFRQMESRYGLAVKGAY